jgi:glutathione S-transferase
MSRRPRPSAADAAAFVAVSAVPAEKLDAFPAVRRWVETVGLFTEATRAAWL